MKWNKDYKKSWTLVQDQALPANYFSENPFGFKIFVDLKIMERDCGLVYLIIALAPWA
jgi:hypothetical protein